ncbi:hypothetical protein [Lishizhenia tianjinensis]|uniref:hypothetical protein n=1 Tax=Lishizhenia tianjinensis TaxID=477690 RepID=UPI0011133D51|nr:hypothetical protein [Lishizhenia tianjinensis]
MNLLTRSTQLGFGVLYNATIRYNNCGQLLDCDITFSSTTLFTYTGGIPLNNKYDFETYALSAFGHGHCLYWVDNGQDIMTGDFDLGEYNRAISYNNELAGNLIMAESFSNGTCLYTNMVMDSSAYCANDTLVDVLLLSNSSLHSNGACADSSDLYLDILSFGNDTVNSIDLKWQVNGGAIQSQSWSGSLLPFDTLLNFYLGHYDFSADTNHYMIWIDQVNGGNLFNGQLDTIIHQFTTVPCTPNNIGVNNIMYFDSSLCYFQEDVEVELYNMGPNTISNCWIYYSVNDLFVDSVFWTGTLLPGESVSNIVLGSHSDFIGIQNFKIWSAMPNGVLDTYTLNDTTEYFYKGERLSGVYTVGDSLSDFVSLIEATKQLSTYGSCSDVTFNVKSGVYLDGIILDKVPVIDTSHSITIQSLAGNKDSVLIHYSLPTYNNAGLSSPALVDVNLTRHLTIKDLTFEYIQTDAFKKLVLLRDSVEFVHLKNIDFKTTDVLNQSYFTYGVYLYGGANTSSYNGDCRNILVDECTFTNFGYGIYVENTANTFINQAPLNLVIKNSKFFNQKRSAIKIDYGSQIQIGNNEFYATDFDFFDQPLVNLENVDDLNLNANKFKIDGEFNCLKIVDCEGTDSTGIWMTNNIFDARSDNFNKAFELDNSEYLHFLHNTVVYQNYDPSYSSSNLVFDLSNIDSFEVKNNIFTFNKKFINAYQSSLSSEDNLFFTPTNSGYSFGSINFNSFADVSDYLTNSGYDTNSIALNPMFSDSVLFKPTNVLINGVANYLPNVSLDFNGVVRDTLNPDLGALEFDVFNYNLGVNNSTLLDTSLCVGSNYNFSIPVTNFGSQIVDSFFVYINYENAFYDTLQIQQTLTPGTSSVVNLGLIPVQSGILSSLTITLVSPNGQIDQDGSNNTGEIVVHSRLSGAYTVGDVSSDFDHLLEALTYIQDYGVCGKVVLNLIDGIHSNQTNSPIELSPFLGMGSDSLIIQSLAQDSSAVTLFGEFGMFDFYRLKNVHFKYLTFFDPSYNQNGPNFTLGALMVRNVQHLSFTQCTFSGFYRLYMYTDNSIYSKLDSVFFDSCAFNNATSLRVGITISAEPSGFFKVSNSRFTGGTIQLEKIDSLVFYNSQLKNYSTTFKNFRKLGVWNNHFYSAISVLNQQDTALIYNNFFSSDERQLSLSGNGLKWVSHNNFRKTGTSLEGIVWLGGNSMTTQFPNVKIVNNIFKVDSGGFVYQGVLFNIQGLNWEIDKNIYHHVTDSFSEEYNVGQEIYKTYDEWKALGLDQNSYFVNPNYSSLIDLHVDNLAQADSAAELVDFVLTDIDGDLRNPLFPDIGADEFDVNYSTYRDLGIDSVISPSINSCWHNDSIHVLLRNYSQFTIDSFKVELRLFGRLIDSFWVYQSLPTQAQYVLKIKKFNFNTNTYYDFNVNISLPNGMYDHNSTNDDLQVEFHYLNQLEIEEQSLEDCDGGVKLAVPLHPDASYIWSTGSTDNAINTNVPGTYYCTMTLFNCTQTATKTLN